MATPTTAKSVNDPKTSGTEPRTVSDLESDIQLLKQDIARLTEQLSRTGEHGLGAAKRAASAGAEHLRARGEDAVQTLRDNAKDFEAQVTANVREKPISSLAIAAGVGYLFALIARR